MWIFLSVVGALFQSINGAINKRNLSISRSSINLIAFINYLTAGIVLAIFLYIQTGTLSFEIKNFANFIYGMFIAVVFNVIGAYYGYKALHISEYSYIAPWLTLTSLFIVIPSFLFLGEIPSPQSFIGIIIVISGAILMDYKKRKDKMTAEDDKDRKQKNRAKLYMLVVGFCYTVTPVGMKMSIIESSAIYVAAIGHLAIALAFLGIIIAYEKTKILKIFNNLDIENKKLFFGLAILAGIGYAISNGSINIAMEEQQASLVMAIKRVAPIFSFIIGYIIFKEKLRMKRKLVATLLMVAGAVLITIYR